MLNYTRIPAPRVTLVDPQTGIVANEWFRFFNNLYTIAYSSTGSVTAGTYGSATAVPQITVDDFGGIVAVTNVPIAIDASQIVSGTIASARISGSYTGITGVGTLTVGSWNASTIGVGYGGTGQTSYTDGQLLIGNSTGNTLTKATLTAGTAIGISNGAGAITITNTLPDQTVVLTNGTGISVTGTYPNFTITNTSPSSGGTVTSVAALTLGTTGTDLSSTVANSTTTPVITLNVPTASAANRGALSAADWTTFNNKAPGVTFTTGYIPFGQGTTTLNQSAGLQFDGTNFTTTGFATATSFRPSSSTVPTNGLYLPATNTLGWATNSTERMRIDSAGNVGIGVTPSTWNQSKALQINTLGALRADATTVGLNNNAYFNAGWIYLTTAAATSYEQNNGTHVWNTAPSGTAGNAVTFTQRMALDINGNLGVGVTPSYKLHVSGSVLLATGATGTPVIVQSGGTNQGTLRFGSGGTEYSINGGADYVAMIFNTAGAERMRIHGLTGGVSIGNTTDPGATNLSVTGRATIQGLTVGLGGGSVATNTALGVSAGAGVNTGTGNTFVGNSSGNRNTSGASNTYIGYQTGFYNLTSSNNTVAGTFAAAGASFASGNNSLFGWASGSSLTSGGSNQFFGYNAGSAVTSGASNVIIGAYTGSAAPISATGSNYVVISDGAANVRAYFNGSIAIFNGTISPVQAATASAPAYVKGALYFDTTLNKLRVGGATAWETVTSV